MTKMHRLIFWNAVNFVGFSVIHVSQGTVATYNRWCGGYTVMYSKFPAESVSEGIFKIGYDLTKLLPKVWWLPFLEHSVFVILVCMWSIDRSSDWLWRLGMSNST